MTARRRLALFVREPVAGAVKTRLEPALGAEGAALLYRAFLEDLSAKLVDSARWKAVAVHDGSVPGPVVRELFGGPWTLLPQGSGNLGERLSRCFRTLAGEGDGVTVVAGSDVPALSPAAVSGAFAALEGSCDVAFAPSPDGGFSLVGIPWPVSAAFLEERISWSTGTALSDAAREARAAGLAVRSLPELPDVDRPEDLEALLELLGHTPEIAPATARALQELVPARRGGSR